MRRPCLGRLWLFPGKFGSCLRRKRLEMSCCRQKSWQEKSLKDLNVRAKLGVNILAVRRNGKINVSPSADFVFRTGDVAVVLGDTVALEGLQKL